MLETMPPDKPSQGLRVCVSVFVHPCAGRRRTQTHTHRFFTCLATRICLSKHSPLSGNEVGPMGAISPESLVTQNRLHCALCTGGDLGLQTDQSAGRWCGWKVWKRWAETRRTGMKTERDASWQELAYWPLLNVLLESKLPSICILSLTSHQAAQPSAPGVTSGPKYSQGFTVPLCPVSMNASRAPLSRDSLRRIILTVLMQSWFKVGSFAD